MKIIQDILHTFSTRIVGILFTLAVTTSIARVLGPEGKGAYSLITLVPSMLILFGDLDLDASNIYFGGSKKHSWNKLVANSSVLAVILGTLLVGGFLVYYFLFHPSFLKDAPQDLVVLAILTVPFGLLKAYFSSVILGQNHVKLYNMLNLAASAVAAVGTVIALLVFHWGMRGVIMVWIAVSVAGAVLPMIIVNRTVPVKWGFYPSVFKETLIFGLKGYLGDMIQFLNYRLDTFLVAFFLNVAFVGYYSVSVALAEALWYLPGSVGTVIVARTAGMSAGDLNRSTPRICRNTLFITLLCALALAVVAKPVIGLLYGPAFSPAVVPLLWLLPGVVALSVCKVLGNEISMRGKPILNAFASFVAVVINVLLNVILIPRMGISGASLASTVSYTVTSIVILFFYLRMSNNSLFDTIIIKPEDLRVYIDVLKKGMKGSFGGKQRSRSY